MRLHKGYEERPADTNFIDVQDTPLHEREIAYYLREAWYKMHSSYPSIDTLAIVWSQVVLETGRNTDRVQNSKMRNYNYGNIKKNLDYSENWTSYDAGEFLGGKHEMFFPYHPQTFFAAWKTEFDGALGYLHFLKNRKRYAAAWRELEEGDTRGYVKELKAGGYFTAPLDKYTAVVVRLTDEFKKRQDDLLSYVPSKPSAPSEESEETPESDHPVEVVTLPEGPLMNDGDLIIKAGDDQPILTVSESEEEEPLLLVDPLPEPDETLTDMIPEQEGESKLNFISRMFLMVWNFIQQLLNKKKD